MATPDEVQQLLERSFYTVKNNHLWTQADHEMLQTIVTELAQIAFTGQAPAVDSELRHRPSIRSLYYLRRRRR